MNPQEKAQFTGRIRNCARLLGQKGVDALGELYDLTAPRLVRYAYTITRNQEDAEDAVQAAMVKIALKPKSLSAANYPWAYFLRVVRNEALGMSRRRKPVPLMEAWIESWNHEPKPYETEEVKRLVHAALAKLPLTQSEVVILKIWEEMTFAEISEILGESSNTAASRYRYAIGKLSRSLQKLSEEMLYD